MPCKLKLYHEKNLRRSRKLRELQPEIEEENTESAETPNTEGYSNGDTISQLSMPNGWSSLAATQISSSYLSAPILFYKMQSTHSMQAELNSTPLKITHSLQINPDFTWLQLTQYVATVVGSKDYMIRKQKLMKHLCQSESDQRTKHKL